MELDINSFWIILTGALVAVSCSMLGSFLVLRKMSMVGDAISHAVLPGIVIAFLLSGSRSTLPMLLGAASFGILTTYLIETFNKKGRLQDDASIGITFTWLFAIGVILITAFASNVDLDQDCVLYGEIAYVPLDLWYLEDGSDLGPRAVWISGGVLLYIFALVFFAYRKLFITTFDPAYAAAIGISTMFWHYLLMSSVSLVTVVSFESVGAILVVAFLIAPAATAYLLTEQLPRMLFLSAIFGILAAFFGYILAYYLDSSIAGAMTTILGVEFLLVFVWVILYKPKSVKEKITL